jgi:hypothetical protein
MRLEEGLKPLARSGNFNVQWRADVLIAGEKITTLPVEGGDITDEADAEINRWRCNLTIPGLFEYIPTNTSDYLWPIGRTEVALKADMSFRGGRVKQEDIPLGVYRVQKPRVVLSSDGDRAITFEGYDRGTTVSRAKLRAGLTIPTGTFIGDFLQDLYEQRLPATQEFSFPDIGDDFKLLVPQQWDRGDDVWVKGKDLVRSFGFDMFFDGDGVCVMDEAADPIDREPDFVHTTGQTAKILWSDRNQATVKGGEYSVDDEDSYNHIIVVAQNSQNSGEWVGEAFDSDPQSPTWIGADSPSDDEFGQSPFGDKLWVVSDQTAVSTAFANKLAFYELLRRTGLTENFAVETFWLPHESRDIVKFIVPELEVENTYVMDGVRQTLNVEGTLQLATRQRRVSGIG